MKPIGRNPPAPANRPPPPPAPPFGKAEKCDLCGFDQGDPVVTITVTLPRSGQPVTRHFCCIAHFFHWMTPFMAETPAETRTPSFGNPFRST